MPAIASQKLNTNDYKNILNYYHIDQTTPNTRKQPLKKQIETILAQKLCSCIKKLNQTVKTSGKRAENNRAEGNRLLPVPVCINNVIKRKHLKIFKFTCKNKKQLLPKAGTTQVLGKTIAQLNLVNKTKKTRRIKIK
jgi:hypothetical protein